MEQYTTTKLKIIVVGVLLAFYGLVCFMLEIPEINTTEDLLTLAFTSALMSISGVGLVLRYRWCLTLAKVITVLSLFFGTVWLVFLIVISQSLEILNSITLGATILLGLIVLVLFSTDTKVYFEQMPNKALNTDASKAGAG